MSSEAAVAVILALTVSAVLLINSGSVRLALGLPASVSDPEQLRSWENVIAAIVGVLAGYISGRSRNE